MFLQLFPTEMTPDEEYVFLQGEGYDGSKNDQIVKWLRNGGFNYEGAINDVVHSWWQSGIYPHYLQGLSPVMVFNFTGPNHYYDDYVYATLNSFVPAVLMDFETNQYALEV